MLLYSVVDTYLYSAQKSLLMRAPSVFQSAAKSVRPGQVDSQFIVTARIYF